MRTCIFVAALFAGAAIHAPAFATETGTMICSGGIVSVGNTAGEVVSGKPGQIYFMLMKTGTDLFYANGLW